MKYYKPEPISTTHQPSLPKEIATLR
jgi:hypothetical protein